MIQFFVPSEPRAKQSFRVGAGRRGGYQSARVKGWQAEVGWEGQKAMRTATREPLQGDVSVSLSFNMSKNARVDLDNLSKAVLDGLNGICFVDDRQVRVLVLRKRVDKSNPGVLVKIYGGS